MPTAFPASEPLILYGTTSEYSILECISLGADLIDLKAFEDNSSNLVNRGYALYPVARGLLKQTGFYDHSAELYQKLKSKCAEYDVAPVSQEVWNEIFAFMREDKRPPGTIDEKSYDYKQGEKYFRKYSANSPAKEVTPRIIHNQIANSVFVLLGEVFKEEAERRNVSLHLENENPYGRERYMEVRELEDDGKKRLAEILAADLKPYDLNHVYRKFRASGGSQVKLAVFKETAEQLIKDQMPSKMEFYERDFAALGYAVNTLQKEQPAPKPCQLAFKKKPLASQPRIVTTASPRALEPIILSKGNIDVRLSYQNFANHIKIHVDVEVGDDSFQSIDCTLPASLSPGTFRKDLEARLNNMKSIEWQGIKEAVKNTADSHRGRE